MTETGEADLDDLIDRWHEGDGEGMELHEYLGMTLDEYRRWVELRPDPTP